MQSDDMLRAALARTDLPPGARAYLDKVQSRARRRPLSERELAAVQRIAEAPSAPDYAAINRAAAERAEDVCRRLLPKGAKHGSHWTCGDTQGAAGASLKIRLAGERAGRWIDNATGERGGDFVSLAAAVGRIRQAEAARRLAGMLGMEAGR